MNQSGRYPDPQIPMSVVAFLSLNVSVDEQVHDALVFGVPLRK